MRKLPETISDEGLLVGWSLEAGHRKPIAGFKKPEAEKIPPAFFLEPILDTGEGHLLTVAPTGAGKGTGCIIPALLRYPGPVVVVDPKGENYAITARRRKEMGQKVILLDPFEITGESDKHSFNPLDLADPSSDRFIEDVSTIAGLIASDHNSNNTENSFWSHMGTTLISAAIIDVLTMSDSETPTLPAVRELLSRPYESLLARSEQWMSSDNSELRRLASLLQNPADVTVGGYLAFAINQLDFLKGEKIKEHLSSSDLDLNQIYNGSPLSIYLVLPPSRLESHSSLLRLWIGIIITVITRRRIQPEEPTLMLLDEAAQLGTLPQLRQAITLLRGYGVRVWSFWQDMSQIINLYPNDWETILNNSRIQQFFGATTGISAKVVCNVTGFGSSEFVMDMEDDELILNITGDEAVISAKPNYLYDPPFKGLFDKNPFYRQKDNTAERILQTRPIFRKSSAPAPKNQTSGVSNEIIQMNRLFHPIPSNEWETLKDQEKENSFQLAGITNPAFTNDPAVNVKRCKLPFYKDHDWYHIEDARTAIGLHSYFAISHEEAFILDGSSAPIHEINGKGIQLNNQNIQLYLEFFCTSVFGDAGRFLVVDNAYEVKWMDCPDKTYIEDLQSHILPPRIISGDQSENKMWELEAEIIYGNTLFTARFRITSEGFVEMADDDPIAADLPIVTDFTQLKYIGIFNENGGFSPLKCKY